MLLQSQEMDPGKPHALPGIMFSNWLLMTTGNHSYKLVDHISFSIIETL